jgi:hypothetical protein
VKRRFAKRAALALLTLAAGCQPEVAIDGDIWVPKWVEGFNPKLLHVYVDVAPEKVVLSDLDSEGIASAPVGHSSGIAIHPRYIAGWEPMIDLEPDGRYIHYRIEVMQEAAFLELRLWIDTNDNGIVDRGDLEGRPRGRVMEARAPSFFSCGGGGTQGQQVIWQTLEASSR